MEDNVKRKSIKSLKKIEKMYGSQRKVALLLNIKPQTFTGYLKNGVPSSRVLQLEKLSNFKVTRSELRSDIYPPE